MLVLEWREGAFIEKVYSRCFCWFSAAILVRQNCAPIWRLHTRLYKCAWNVSANNSETVGHKDLRLGQIVEKLVFYNISFSWLPPQDGFRSIFLLRDSENDPYSQTLHNADNPLLRTVSAFVPGESSLLKFKPLNTNTPLIRTLSMAPSESVCYIHTSINCVETNSQDKVFFSISSTFPENEKCCKHMDISLLWLAVYIWMHVFTLFKSLRSTSSPIPQT